MLQPVMVISSWPDPISAKQTARLLIEQKLAACVNVVPSVTSVYRWEGEICSEDETLLLIKTTNNKIEQLKKIIQNQHSYQLPEVIVLPITDGLAGYLDWVSNSIN